MGNEAKKAAPVNMNPSKLVNSLYEINKTSADTLLVSRMHPAVKDCGLKLISGDQLQSTN